MAVETPFSEPHDSSRNLSGELQEVHQKTYHARRHMSHPGSRSQKFEVTTPRDTAHDQDQVPIPEDGKNALDLLNASATRPSSSASVTRSISNQSIVPSPEDGKNALDLLNASATRPSSSASVTGSISNQSIVELTPIAITQDTAVNNSSKDLRRSSSRNGVSEEANNQEETQECNCGAKFKAEKSKKTKEEFLLGDQYCDACRKVIRGAESSSDSGRRIKEEEERSSLQLKKQKQETKGKKKTWKNWLS